MPWVRSIFDSVAADTPFSAESSPELEKRTLHDHSQTAARHLGLFAGHFHPYSRANTDESTSTDDEVPGKRMKGANKSAQREKKRLTEKQSREEVNRNMGLLELSLKEKKPSLPYDRNWKRLNASNIGSKDRQSAERNPTPLKHNKLDILTAARDWTDQTELLLKKIVEYLVRLGEIECVQDVLKCQQARCTEDFDEVIERFGSLMKE